MRIPVILSLAAAPMLLLPSSAGAMCQTGLVCSTVSSGYSQSINSGVSADSLIGTTSYSAPNYADTSYITDTSYSSDAYLSGGVIGTSSYAPTAYGTGAYTTGSYADAGASYDTGAYSASYDTSYAQPSYTTDSYSTGQVAGTQTTYTAGHSVYTGAQDVYSGAQAVYGSAQDVYISAPVQMTTAPTFGTGVQTAQAQQVYSSVVQPTVQSVAAPVYLDTQVMPLTTTVQAPVTTIQAPVIQAPAQVIQAPVIQTPAPTITVQAPTVAPTISVKPPVVSMPEPKAKGWGGRTLYISGALGSGNQKVDLPLHGGSNGGYTAKMKVGSQLSRDWGAHVELTIDKYNYKSNLETFGGTGFLMGQYRLPLEGNLRPYAELGVGYGYFLDEFDEDAHGLGVRAGLGLDYGVTHNTSVFAEAQYTYYPGLKIGGTDFEMNQTNFSVGMTYRMPWE